MGQERLLLFKIFAIFTGVGCLVAASLAFAQTSAPAGASEVYLMSGAGTSKRTNTLHDLSEVKERPRRNNKVTQKPIAPSLGDIGLDLKNSHFSKRNELESFNIQPWAPGRGGVGVKVEVTW
jgi:hypothetical protein